MYQRLYYVTLYMSIKKNVGCKNIRMKTHKLMLHCRNNDILFLRKDKYSKQACYTFKFHPRSKYY